MKNKNIILACICLFVSHTSYTRIVQSGNGNAILGASTITNAGFYRLPQDINNSTQAISISVEASDVVIDLEGHTITGSNIAGQNDIGISISGHQNITIKNGTILNTNTNGIFIEDATNITIENITFAENTTCALINTSTLINISECNFKNNNTSFVISADQIISMDVKNCVFVENKIISPIFITDSSAINIDTISIYQNHNDGNLIGINILTSNNININNVAVNQNIIDDNGVIVFGTLIAINVSTCQNCIIANCVASGNIVVQASINLFNILVNTENIVMNNCHASNNVATTFLPPICFSFNGLTGGVITNCSAIGNNFQTTNPTGRGFILANNVSNVVIQNIEISNNTIESPSIYSCLDLIGTSSLVLDHCITTSNTHTTSDMVIVRLTNGSRNNIITNCLINNNTAINTISGIAMSSDSINNFVSNNIVTNNFSTAAFGISGNTQSTLLQNQVERADFPYFPLPNVPVATYTRSTGTITPSGADTLTYDNLSIT